MTPLHHRIPNWLQAFLSGIAAALGHAPFGLWPVALVGLSWLICRICVAERRFLVAWAGGLGYFVVTLHWIVEPFLVDVARHGWMAPFALAFLAGGLALFWGAAGWLSARMAGPRALNIAIALAAAEVLRGHIFTGFPWALPGYIWVDTPVRIAAAITGSYGLTLLTLIAVALPYVWPQFWKGALAGTALLAVLALPGVVHLPLTEPEPLGRVRILQPDIAQSDKWNPDRVTDNFAMKLDLSRGETPVDLVIWPETAVVYPLDTAEPALEAISAATGGTPFLTGINRREGGDWHNSLVVVGADRAVAEAYDKVHLVPFGEYIPFRIGFIRAMAGFSSNGFTAGDAVRLIDTPLGRALPLICYEGIFPGHLFRAGERADYLLLITNDAWFGTFAGPQQHFDQARFRATEHGLPLVRVANRGTSTVIDGRGNPDPAATLPPGAAGSVDAVVPAPAVPTLYARTGDWPVFGLLVLAIASALILSRRNRIATPPGVG